MMILMVCKTTHFYWFWRTNNKGTQMSKSSHSVVTAVLLQIAGNLADIVLFVDLTNLKKHSVEKVTQFRLQPFL